MIHTEPIARINYTDTKADRENDTYCLIENINYFVRVIESIGRC